MSIKILVATHKMYWMPDSDIYYPIELGRVLHTKKLPYHGDDEGLNISSKQPNYCELTALYWGWKNLSCDYMGLCHYRRYFGSSNKLKPIRTRIYQNIDWDKIFNECDIILPKKRHYFIETVKSQYEHAHHISDLITVGKVIAEISPEYSDTFEYILNKKELYLYNMFIMKKSLVDQYCEWVFPILFELERRIDISDYTPYQQRVFGYIAERLFNVWIEKNNLRIKESNIIFLGKQNWCAKIYRFLCRKFK